MVECCQVMLRVIEKNNFGIVDKDAWNRLVDKTGASMFQSFEWSELWWRHFGEGNLKILEVFDNKNLVGIAPFCEREGVISLIGGVDITDYEDVIVLTEYREQFWENVFSYLKDFIKFDFHFVPPNGTCEVIQKMRNDFHFHSEEVAPYIDLPDSFETYVSNLPRHDRQELRRKMRKLEAGVWKLEKAKDGNDVDNFISLHKNSDTAKDKFMTNKMEKFFREMAKIFYGLGKLDLCYLVVDGKKVAATLSFKEKDRILAYNAGFDLSYGYLSVGLLAHVYAIKEAIEKELKVYDFLRGNERYKYQLGAKDKSLYNITNFDF